MGDLDNRVFVFVSMLREGLDTLRVTAALQIALIGSRRGESSTSLRFPGSSDWLSP